MVEVPTPNDRQQIYSDTRPAYAGLFLLEASLTTTTQTERLAAALLADRNRKTTERTDIGACFMCARGMIYRGSRFCSDRCRDYYDTGAPGCEQNWRQPDIAYTYRDGRPMAKGVHGFKINCAHCHKESDSRGLRWCSVECERGYRERQTNIAILAEVGAEVKEKRRCAECERNIPTWRNGRRVSAALRYCSPKCRQKGWRDAGGQNQAA